MLRSLDVNTGQPKSKGMRPTKDEVKNFSKGELAFIDKQFEQNDELLVTRAVDQAQRNAVRDKLLGGGEKR